MDTKTLLYRQPELAHTLPALQKRRFVPITPYLFLFAMGCTLFLLDAILPLRDLWFYNALLTLPVRSWLLLPTHLLFPGTPTVSVLAGVHRTHPSSTAVAWQETRLLLVAFALLFLCYLFAVRALPRTVTHRFILLSTLLLGLLYLCIPVVTSEDIFSYIAYARMFTIYHLNPLSVLPTAITKDLIYPYLYWTKQPSIYGPVWLLLSAILQWGGLAVGLTHIASMVLLLRLFSLAMHLGSVQLIWSISGKWQGTIRDSATALQWRRRATLAFAWNPLLLAEACLNAHVDTTMFFFVLLALWTLLHWHTSKRYAFLSTLLAAVLLAVASCVKITLILFLPGLLLFLWIRQPHRWLHTTLAAFAYIGTLLLLYVPFWNGGAILRVLNLNPGAFHAINSPYAFLIYLSASLRGSYVPPANVSFSSHIEHVAHVGSITLFVIAYALLLLHAFYTWRHKNAWPSFLRWMAVAWLLYCLIGSPWFWPWYMVTFLGLYTLIEANNFMAISPITRVLNFPLAARLLSFSMLSVYCFLSYAPVVSFVPPFTHLTWAELGGLWIWSIPLLALFVPLKSSARLHEQRKPFSPVVSSRP
jgi:hypothetical protein